MGFFNFNNPEEDVLNSSKAKTWSIPTPKESIAETFSNNGSKEIVKGASIKVDTGRVNTGRSTDLYDIATGFNFTRFPDYYNAPRPQSGHIFMTKPDLNLTDENVFKDEMLASFRMLEGWEIYKSLLTGGDGFIPLVYNRAINYQVKPFSLNVTEKGMTYFGSSIHYAKHSSERLKAHNFSMDFYNDEYFSIVYLFAIWARYAFLVSRGRIEPRKEYEVSGQLDYAASIYFLDTQIDGRKITYWEKQVGVFPTEIPFDIFSMDESAKLTDKISIGFESSLPDDPFAVSAIDELRIQTNSPNKVYNRAAYTDGQTIKYSGPFFATMPVITSIYKTNNKTSGVIDWVLSWR